jgi:hypothetical protein
MNQGDRRPTISGVWGAEPPSENKVKTLGSFTVLDPVSLGMLSSGSWILIIQIAPGTVNNTQAINKNVSLSLYI